MTVTVRYFAMFRETIGKDAEVVSTAASNAGELYDELAARHAFGIGRESIAAAVNDEIVPMDDPIHDGDQIAFLSPFGGG